MQNQTAVILPLHPKWAQLIKKGKKIDELRKDLWKKKVSKIYFYVTAPIQKVKLVTEDFTVFTKPISQLKKDHLKTSQVSSKEFDKYYQGKLAGSVIRLNSIEEVDIDPFKKWPWFSPTPNFCYVKQLTPQSNSSLQNFTFITGDSMDPNTWPKDQIDMVLGDPPFKPEQQGYKQRSDVKKKLDPIETPTDDDWFKMMNGIVNGIIERKIVDESTYFIWKLDDYSAREYYNHPNNPLHFHYTVKWDKGRIGMGHRIRKQHEVLEMYLNNHDIVELYSMGEFSETYWHQRKKKTKSRWHGSSKAIAFPSIVKIPNYNNGTKGVKLKDHINGTPWELWVIFLYHCLPPRGLIFDPFMGSGSIAKAVYFLNKHHNRNYRYWGVELDPKHAKQAEEEVTAISTPKRDLFNYYRYPATGSQNTLIKES